MILSILIFDYLLKFTIETLNAGNIKYKLPEEFRGYYDDEKYKTSQKYLKVNTYFTLAEETFFLFIIILSIALEVFNIADLYARSFGFGEIVTGLIFSGIVFLAYEILRMPFNIYKTFVIEQKFGFNKTTLSTFVSDIIKSWALTGVLAAIVLTVLIWFFDRAGSFAWIYCWITVVVFELLMVFIAPVWIMPLFNKFVPLEEGRLMDEIKAYAESQNFKLGGIFKMDGSKRSSKSNAFFTGFGKYKRIALFDTLINNHTVEELVSVLAHEIGHYKLKHVLKSIVFSILSTGLMFFILSLFIKNAMLFAAFGMREVSIYASFIFFTFLYSPVNLVFAVFGNILSRKNEFEADEYAVSTYLKTQAFINALKKLSVNNLSNLTPHRFKVFMEYTHPPVLKRIKRLEEKHAKS